jgi:hypothetical protein
MILMVSWLIRCNGSPSWKIKLESYLSAEVEIFAKCYEFEVFLEFIRILIEQIVAHVIDNIRRPSFEVNELVILLIS